MRHENGTPLDGHQLAAEIDVRDDLTRRRSRRLHCRFHHWAVSAVEHDRDALTEQSMWTAKLAVDCAQ